MCMVYRMCIAAPIGRIIALFDSMRVSSGVLSWPYHVKTRSMSHDITPKASLNGVPLRLR